MNAKIVDIIAIVVMVGHVVVDNVNAKIVNVRKRRRQWSLIQILI
jgi:hypothetical protein